jgi:Flp pilus assembly protein TadD
MKRHLLTLVALILLAGCGSRGSHDLGGSVDGLQVARAAAASGNVELAETVYANAAKSSPADTDVQLAYADTLIRTNKVAQARAVLTKAVKTVRHPEMLHGPLGAIYVLTGEATQAVGEFDAAIAADSSNTRWSVDKGVALDMLGKHSEAQALYHVALASDPDDYIATINLALSLALDGQRTEAANIAATLADRTDLPQRVSLTSTVLRAANGGDVSSTKEALGPTGYDQMMKLARAIGKTN